MTLNQTNHIKKDSDRPTNGVAMRSLEFNQAEQFDASDGNGSITQNSALSLVTALKADLEQVKDVVPESLEKLLQLEKWASKAIATSQHIKRDRDWLLTIGSRMRSTANTDDLFKILVTDVYKYFNVDRALIYRFDSENQGVVIAEAAVSSYTPMGGQTLAALAFGAPQRRSYQQHQVVALNQISQTQPNYYQLQLLQNFQIQAGLSIPIILEDRVWGLLVVQQCSGYREWQETEISLLYHLVTELTLVLQTAQFRTQMQKQADQAQYLSKAIEKIRSSWNLNTIFNTTVREVRQLLGADRVGVFRFEPDSGFDDGEFIAEDVNPGYSSVLSHKIHDHCFGEQYAAYYAQGRLQVLPDVYTAGLKDCHLQLLVQFQVRANLVVPLLKGNELWGLLCVHQCSKPRQWEVSEIESVKQIAALFGSALYQEQVQAQQQQMVKTTERERSVAKVIDKIRKSKDINTIFRTTAQDVRKLLGVERITIYKLRPDYFGDFVVESESGGWPKLVGSGWEDTYLQEHQGGRFRKNEPFVIDDVENADLSDCHVEKLEYFGVKACAVVAIMQGQKLWGLLSAFQHSGPRHWEESEVSLLTQIGTQLGVALQQAEYIEELHLQSQRLALSLDRGTSYSRLVYRLGVALIQENFSLSKLFLQAVPEVRRQLQTDRVAIYRFNSDWSGEFIVEDVGSEWIKVVGTDLAKLEDLNLQEARGGRYRRKETLSVNNVDTVEHDEFQVLQIELWGTKAYIIAPIFKGDKLWGLLGAYQNDGPRQWEQIDINLLAQVGVQIGLAVLQAEYLEQLRSSTQQLAEAGTREKIAKEKLQQEVIQLLTAVRPALNGNLTVRAPVTETEVGTVADAYNNTLQSLRQIVKQVQTASRKVAQTSLKNESSISGLATQAQQQYQALSQSLELIETMVSSTLTVGTNAQHEVEAAVRVTNQTVREGDAAMNRTVDGILDIRETVAETSDRLTRLSESSQKVSKVVNLIRSFTTQTQILALNAAIEATRAGEYGRGFGVVADEVRTLARQSAEATTEIEQLVQNILEGTAEVAIALSKSIHQVEEGTEMVQDARQNLNAIVEATNQISQLVEGITHVTQVQTEQFQLVTQTMTDVAKIAHKTSEDSVEISTSFKDLLAMAQDLQSSADQFKVD